MQHIAPWFFATAAPADEGFAKIIEEVWQDAVLAIPTISKCFPEGHSEFESGTSRVQGYLNNAERLGALRVVRDDHGKRAKLHISELIIAYPKNKPPVVGVRAWTTLRNGNPATSPVAQPSGWEALLSHTLITPHAEAQKLPFYDELIQAVRVAESQVPRASKEDCEAPRQEDLDELLLELSYYKQLTVVQAAELKESNHKLKALQDSLSFKNAFFDEENDNSDEVEKAWTLEQLPLWAAEHEEQIIIHPRAFIGAKRSLYSDESEILKALEFIAGPYRLLRKGELPLSQYQELLKESGFGFSGSTTYQAATYQGEAYFIRYKSSKHFLEFHLTKGGGRDPRYCLRVYFFWDNEEKKAVVGWLPSHLDNTLT